MKVKEMKRDYTLINSIALKEHEFLKLNGRRANKMRASYDFYCDMLNNSEIIHGFFIVKDFGKEYYKDMEIIIDNSIERFEVE